MSGNKDLLNDYFNAYPVLRYLMPKVMNSNGDVTNRLLFMKQAAWVLIKLLQSNTNVVASRGRVDLFNKQTLTTFTASDLHLLSVVLKELVKSLPAEFKSANFIADLKKNEIDFNSGVAPLPAPLPSADVIFKYILDVLNITSNSFTDDKVASLVLLSKWPHTDTVQAAPVVVVVANDVQRLSDSNLLYSVELSELLKYNLATEFRPISSKLTITFALPKVDSFIGSLVQFKPSATTSRSDFVQDMNGRFVLRTTESDGKVSLDEFDTFFSKLIKDDKDFCKAFGSNKDVPGENEKCAVMVAECLGNDLVDKEACKVHFKDLGSVSKTLVAWNGLSDDQKRYAAYRVLLGYGITGSFNRNGDYAYIDEKDLPLLGDDDIIKHFSLNPGDAALSDKVAYIKRLMTKVGVIITQSRDPTGRPMMVKPEPAKQLQLLFTPALIPAIGMGGMAGMGMGMGMGSGFGHMMRPMVGGNEETAITGIQYGGGMNDIKNITRRIKHMIDILRQRNAIPSDKVTYINDKLSKLIVVANEVDNGESMLNDYLIVSSQFPNKNNVFTEDDIRNIKAKLDADKKKMEDKLNKFSKLEMRLVTVMN